MKDQIYLLVDGKCIRIMTIQDIFRNISLKHNQKQKQNIDNAIEVKIGKNIYKNVFQGLFF